MNFLQLLEEQLRQQQPAFQPSYEGLLDPRPAATVAEYSPDTFTPDAEGLSLLSRMALGFAPGAGVGDFLGQFPDAEGGLEPGALENWEMGNYGTTVLQSLGALGDVAMLVPGLGLLGAIAKAPRTAQRATRTASSAPEGLLDLSYRGTHTAPDASVYGATLDNLEGIMPANVYSPEGKRLYGLFDRQVDNEWFNAATKAKGNPDAPIDVYRAVPKGVKNINDGDWVTTSRRYAEMHGENTLDGNYEIIKQTVPARSLHSEGAPYEFGYRAPQTSRTQYDEAMEVAQRNAALPVEQGGLGLPADNTAMDRARAMGFDVDNPLYHGTKASNIEQLIPSRGGEFGGGVYTSPEPLTANQFAAYARGESGENILPLVSRAENPLVTSDRNIPRGMGTKTMQKKGFDSVVGTTPSGQIQNVVFDPAMLRSRFAAFDPAKRNLRDILAGIGATGIGLGLLSPMLEDERY